MDIVNMLSKPKNKLTMRKESFPFLLLASAVVLSMMSLVLSMRWGPGIGGDATIYITSARNFLAGNGLGLLDPGGEFRLLPYFPPFFSLVLSLLGLLGMDQVEGAYWINLLTFGGLVWAAGSHLLRNGRQLWISLFTALILGLSPILIPVFSWAMSEPLAIFLGFSSFITLLNFLENGKRRWLVLSAILAGLSFLTRYSSAAFVAAGCVGIAWFGRKRPRKPLLFDLMLYGLVAILPMAVWMIVDISQTATLASRSIEGGMLGRLTGVFPLLKDVFLLWLLPESLVYNPPYPAVLNFVFMVAAFSGFLLLCVWVGWRVSRVAKDSGNDGRVQLAVLLGSLIISYLLVIVLVYITTYPPITIGSRMLSPVHAAVLWLAGLLCSLLVDTSRGKTWLRRVVVLALLAAFAWYGVRSGRIVMQNFEEGLGYLSRSWQQSETIQAVLELPQSAVIVTNETNAILFLTDRLSYPVKEIYLDEPLQEFSAYGEGDLSQDEGQRIFREEGAPLVLFDTIDDQFYSLYGERTAERIGALVNGLHRAFRGADGGIFYCREP
jgi:hypothetical protein